MSKSTIFRAFSIPIEDKSLMAISSEIASGKYKMQIEEIRSLLAQGNAEQAQAKKQQLLAFTPSATFAGKRLMSEISQYSGVVHIDFDKIPLKQIEEAFQLIKKSSYTLLCFRSPSGNGLKVFAEVNTPLDQHDIAYQQVMKHYEAEVGLKADQKCKDITRLCFMSSDTELFINADNEKFQVRLNPGLGSKNTYYQDGQLSNVEVPFNDIFLTQMHFTDQKAQYLNGNRNNYIFLLASNCNRAGIPGDQTLKLCSERFDLPLKELTNSIQSAYAHHRGEFAKFAKFANFANGQYLGAPDLNEQEDQLMDYLKTTPVIPDKIYETLPAILRKGAMAFSENRRRDVFFTGAIAIISGCLPKVTGVYGQERVYPHLFTFIIAPAASGKGVLKNAKRLADKYHQRVIEVSQLARKEYQAKLIDFKELQVRKTGKNQPQPEKPEEPPFKIVFIPANCSCARLVDHLKKNDEQGIICETEADSMSSAKNQEWGDYSHYLRNAFHHDTIGYSRKTNDERIEVNKPRLAVALSGTPDQVPKLISSAEDGLFSRFLFYAFKNEIVWMDPSPKSQAFVYNDHFDALGDELLTVIDFLEYSPTDIHLQPSQWETFNKKFTEILRDVTLFTSEAAAGIVYRLGLILFRFCMVFTALRKVENGEMTENMLCTPEDFDSAIAISQIYLDHSLLMFNNLPKQGDSMLFRGGDSKRKFFEALPLEFNRKHAIELGRQFKLGSRTVDEMLRTAIGKTLSKIKSGAYRKV